MRLARTAPALVSTAGAVAGKPRGALRLAPCSPPANDLPLAGIRVVEFTHMVMGPTCGMVLADLGAEVIKVEPLAGDNTRQLLGSGAGFFPLFNRNKKSIALDLQQPEGREVVLRLIATADIVSENFKPGHHEEAGAGLRQPAASSNPRLIYVSHKGFLPGPYDHRTALDEVVQMMGGLAYMTGRPGDPLRAGTSVNDIMGGMFGAIGAMAALAQREQTGKGQEVQSALFENNVFLVAQHMMQFAVTGKPAAPMPEPHLGLGRVRRVHGEGRRADLPGGGERHAVGAVLRGLRLRRPAGRPAPDDQQRPRARARLADAAAARAPGRTAARPNWRRCSRRNGLPFAPDHPARRSCSTTRTCSTPAAWRPCTLPDGRADARCRCCRSRWTASARACAWTRPGWASTAASCWRSWATARRDDRGAACAKAWSP